MPWLEAAAVATTLLAVYLTARQVLWCWPLSMLSVAMYALVFARAGLYAEVGLQALYFVLSAYGWWAWRHGTTPDGRLEVTRVPGLRLVALSLAAATCGLALGATLSRFTEASLPWLDSQLAAFSVLAQWMQTRKLLQAWCVWIAVDVAYVGMFAVKDLMLTAGLYAAFLALAFEGWRAWHRSMARLA